MKISSLSIPDIKLVTPDLYRDGRGWFMETWNARDYEKAGISSRFVQACASHSGKNILRGLHYQIQHAQAKLIRVASGAIRDVAVDLRKSSSTFSKHVVVELNAQEPRFLFIPEGFAHGFLALQEETEIQYLVSDFRYAEFERSILWSDSDLNIAWNIELPVLSERDQSACAFRDADYFQ